MPPLDDVALVRRFVRNKDEQAFRALYRAHTPAMLGVVVRLVGGRGEAEDVVQEAWLKASAKLPEFRWESALRTWLVGIAINCARSRLRRRAPEGRDVELATVAEMPAPGPVTRPIDAVDLERALTRLPDGYREVLLLHDLFGYTHDEIAAMLGVESGTSKSQLSRARSSLRRWLAEKGNHRERRSE